MRKILYVICFMLSLGLEAQEALDNTAILKVFGEYQTGEDLRKAVNKYIGSEFQLKDSFNKGIERRGGGFVFPSSLNGSFRQERSYNIFNESYVINGYECIFWTKQKINSMAEAVGSNNLNPEVLIKALVVGKDETRMLPFNFFTYTDKETGEKKEIEDLNGKVVGLKNSEGKIINVYEYVPELDEVVEHGEQDYTAVYYSPY